MAPLPLSLRLTPRQSTPSDSTPSCTCPDTLSGGAVAGIVLGSIAGNLLLIWLFRTCMVTKSIQEAEDSGGGYGYVGAAPYTNEATTRHYRRRRRRSPVYEEYGYGEKGSVRRPRRVYLAS